MKRRDILLGTSALLASRLRAQTVPVRTVKLSGATPE